MDIKARPICAAAPLVYALPNNSIDGNLLLAAMARVLNREWDAWPSWDAVITAMIEEGVV
jgi:hypothetical protein